jgi:hypothetical protein
MFLIQVDIDGTVTPNYRIDGWQWVITKTYRDICSPKGISFGDDGYLYMGVYSTQTPTHLFSFYKLDMNAPVAAVFKKWNIDVPGMTNSGGVKAVLVNTDQ